MKDKLILISMYIILIFSFLDLVLGITLSYFLFTTEAEQILFIILIFVLFLFPCFFALKLEVSIGYYECKKCKHKITPKYKEALNAIHFGTTRYLKCPNCGKRRWCRKRFK